MTGIDISADQLARNARLDRKVLGDVQRHDFGDAQFDVVICWDVLEHVPDPTAAMRTMTRCLAPRGILIVAVPHVWSIKGLVTKFTPFAVHAWYYRHIIGDKRVGVTQSDQFATVLALAMAPGRLVKSAATLGCDTLCRVVYQGPVQRTMRARFRSADMTFWLFGMIMRFVTLGRTNLLCSDVVLVFQRRDE